MSVVLPEPLGPTRLGDAGRNGEVDPVHAQHFAVELRDVLEDDLVLVPAHFTTSIARTLRYSRPRQPAQINISMTHAEAEEISEASWSRKSLTPDRHEQVHQVDQLAPLHIEYRINRLAESGGDEEDRQQQSAGRDPPLDPCRKGQRQQRDDQNPDPRAGE